MPKTAINQRISALQTYMKDNEVHAWIVLSSDPHLSEYLPLHWQLRSWFSGFTGSAGTLVVTQKDAFIWADSRYWVQAEKELSNTTIRLQKMGEPNTPSYIQYLATNLNHDDNVAVLGNTISISAFMNLHNALDDHDISVITDLDPFDELYTNRPALPQQPIIPHNPKFVSQSTSEKLNIIRQTMTDTNSDYHLISTLDDIAWTLNLRGSDVECNPVFLAYLLIESNQATLYVDQTKLSSEAKALLTESQVQIADYTAISQALHDIPTDSVILLDPDRTTFSSLQLIDESVEIAYQINPSTLAKAQKTDADLVHIRQAMEEDGVALCEFFSAFETKLANKTTVSELTVADMLQEARGKRPNFVTLSFSTIAGFNENGALPHYAATKEAYSLIEGDGLLLIDSGGQYEYGTTDITRVIPIGTISDAQKRDFTLVLKAMIGMSRTHFPENIKMPLLDAIARAPLWKEHLDYGHGTGHGVGYFMNVHEGPQVLSYHAAVTPQTEVKKGMITSIEPGLYREGKWGIRIENLVVSLPVSQQKEDSFGSFMYFETLTLCPIDTRCINPDLMTDDEITWLNQYHKEVFTRLSPKISNPDVLAWLTQRTQPL